MYHSSESGLFYIMERPFVLYSFFLYCKTHWSIKTHLDFKEKCDGKHIYVKDLKNNYPRKVNLLLYSRKYGMFHSVGFEVLAMVVMKSSIFWNITPTSPLEVDQHFGGTCCLHL
jgi:hypothetical protein